MSQKGFATLEVILMVMVIGILASIAVPRFTSVTTAANTSKIQADLSTIDTAISVYYMEHGEYPTQLSNLSDYLNGTDGALKPPSGKCYLTGATTATDVPATEYTIKAASGDTPAQAICGTDNTSEKFYVPKKSSSNG
ncbi:MAG: type II secretion system protein GspG [Selenomonadaceae bacterium]|nr:type II secretion system protein GspG [Selenomonadaceae bacterium]